MRGGGGDRGGSEEGDLGGDEGEPDSEEGGELEAEEVKDVGDQKIDGENGVPPMLRRKAAAGPSARATRPLWAKAYGPGQRTTEGWRGSGGGGGPEMCWSSDG